MARKPSPLRPNELALVGVGATVFLLALGALVGVALASFLFGGGWVWPAGVSGAAHELGGLLSGRLADRRVPGDAAVWTVVVFVELVVLAAAVLFARWAGGVVRPSPGGATRAEIAAAFGRRRHRGAPAWRLGRARGVELWVPYARTVGVIGPTTSGKTLDVVAHAELAAPGALVQASAKPDDVLLTLTRRGEPVAVFDPLGAVPGLPPLIWDPLRGCVDSTVATRRAKAFCAGTAPAADDAVAARVSAAEAAKVLACYLHAAALTGRTIDHVLTWVADPVSTDVPETILREHPHAEPHWADLLRNALREPPTDTLQLAMDALLHKEIAQRCLPGTRRPATDVADVLARDGTIYVLGQDDPVVSVSPLLTAVADDVLALAPPDTVVVLDDLPSVPVPTLPLGVVWTAASRAGVAPDVLVYLGAAAPTVERTLRPGEAVVVAAGVAPFVARLRRVLDGKPGAELLADLERARARASTVPDPPWHARRDPARSALVAAHERGLHPDSWRQP